jgi:hypothetical protein
VPTDFPMFIHRAAGARELGSPALAREPLVYAYLKSQSHQKYVGQRFDRIVSPCLAMIQSKIENAQ